MTLPSFLQPRCPDCGDTGEVLADETPTAIGLKPEWRPCTCVLGQVLEAELTAQMEALWASIPLVRDANDSLTPEDRNNER